MAGMLQNALGKDANEWMKRQPNVLAVNVTARECIKMFHMHSDSANMHMMQCMRCHAPRMLSCSMMHRNGVNSK